MLCSKLNDDCSHPLVFIKSQRMKDGHHKPLMYRIVAGSFSLLERSVNRIIWIGKHCFNMFTSPSSDFNGFTGAATRLVFVLADHENAIHRWFLAPLAASLLLPTALCMDGFYHLVEMAVKTAGCLARHGFGLHGLEHCSLDSIVEEAMMVGKNGVGLVVSLVVLPLSLVHPWMVALFLSQLELTKMAEGWEVRWSDLLDKI